MAFALVVRHPFGSHAKGAVIFDAATVAKIEADPALKKNVTRIAYVAPVAPVVIAPAPAPALPQSDLEVLTAFGPYAVGAIITDRAAIAAILASPTDAAKVRRVTVTGA